MKYISLFLVGYSFVGCFEPPGSTCTQDTDCPENQRCIVLETRSVCLNTSAGDVGEQPTTDAAVSPIDGGSVIDGGSPIDAGQPATDSGSSVPDAGLSSDDAGVEPEPAGLVATLGADHSCAVDGDSLRCWGANADSQLGLSDSEQGAPILPVQASATGPSAPDRLAAGHAFT